jgi:hypothetical protein
MTTTIRDLAGQLCEELTPVEAADSDVSA